MLYSDTYFILTVSTILALWFALVAFIFINDSSWVDGRNAYATDVVGAENLFLGTRVGGGLSLANTLCTSTST